MFGYCNNNPVNYSDSNGQSPVTATPSPNGVTISGEREFETKYGTVTIVVFFEVELVDGITTQICGAEIEFTANEIIVTFSDGQTLSFDLDLNENTLALSSYSSRPIGTQSVQLTADSSGKGVGGKLYVETSNISGTILVAFSPNEKTVRKAAAVIQKAIAKVSGAVAGGGFFSYTSSPTSAFFHMQGKCGGGGGLRMVNVTLFLM